MGDGLLDRANETVAEADAVLKALGTRGHRHPTEEDEPGSEAETRSIGSERYGMVEAPLTMKRSSGEEELDHLDEVIADHLSKQRAFDERRRIRCIEEPGNGAEADDETVSGSIVERSVSHGEILYKKGIQDAQRKEEARLQAQAERVEKEMAEATFCPQISKKAQHMKGRGGHEQAWSRLYRAGASLEARREARSAALRQEQDEKEMRECSFRPQVSERSERMVERKRSAFPENITSFERLHYQGMRQKAEWEARKEFLALPQDATFAPKINNRATKTQIAEKKLVEEDCHGCDSLNEEVSHRFRSPLSQCMCWSPKVLRS
jgi:hypothetical protein